MDFLLVILGWAALVVGVFMLTFTIVRSGLEKKNTIVKSSEELAYYDFVKNKYMEHDTKEHKYLREQAVTYATYNRRKYKLYLKTYPEAKTDFSEYLYQNSHRYL